MEAGDIFPNPSNGYFRIGLAHIQPTAAMSMEVKNEFGQSIYHGNKPCNNGVIELDLTGEVINGIYMVSCTVSRERIVRKWMVSNW